MTPIHAGERACRARLPETADIGLRAPSHRPACRSASRERSRHAASFRADLQIDVANASHGALPREFMCAAETLLYERSPQLIVVENALDGAGNGFGVARIDQQRRIADHFGE